MRQQRQWFSSDDELNPNRHNADTGHVTQCPIGGGSRVRRIQAAGGGQIIPTLLEWGLIILMLLASVGVIWTIARRRRVLATA